MPFIRAGYLGGKGDQGQHQFTALRLKVAALTAD